MSRLPQSPPRHRRHKEAWGGEFFVTFNVNERDRMNGPQASGPLGTVDENGVTLSAAGMIVRELWEELPRLFRSVDIGESVVMPDHFHGILHLKPAVVGNQVSFKPLNQIVAALKSVSSKRINELDGRPGRAFWQRGFYDRIVRDEKIHRRVSAYILNNPRALFRRLKPHGPDNSSGGLQSATTIIRAPERSG